MSQTSVSAITGHPGVPNWDGDATRHRRQIAAAVNRHNLGKFNVAVDVTLNANTGATIITDSRIGYNSAISPLMGLTLSAAVAIAAGIWFDGPSIGAGSTASTIVAHHNITADTDKKVRFGIFG